MSLEVHCDVCGQGFITELAGPTELPCPVCGARLSVAASLPESRSAAVAEPSAIEAHAATADEVVCPRCGLHFRSRAAQAAPAARARRTILVLEDMDYFQELLAEALEPRYEVRLARTIAEADAVLAREPVHLILVDPGLDGGRGGLAWLARLRPKPCPVLIFTAEDESEIYGAPWKRLRELGADDLVLKGLHAGEAIQRKVAELLGEPADAFEGT